MFRGRATNATAAAKHVSASEAQVRDHKQRLKMARTARRSAYTAQAEVLKAASLKNSFQEQKRDAKGAVQDARYNTLELTWYGRLWHRIARWR
ncbi:hypothetical protein [Actinoallomurus sp. CA-150999]|uniref:hypothetical protein n=1 Tax=Actinoallomurus sp. CA-150999 TaxID=3239887 RepID=UPI003D8A1C9B